jgi:hypothetical protein
MGLYTTANLGFVVRDVGTGKRYAMDRLTVGVIDPQILRGNPDTARQSQVARGASVQLVDEAANPSKGWHNCVSAIRCRFLNRTRHLGYRFNDYFGQVLTKDL